MFIITGLTDYSHDFKKACDIPLLRIVQSVRESNSHLWCSKNFILKILNILSSGKLWLNDGANLNYHLIK